MACKLITNRAFILKVKNFCKYYPLKARDPEFMIRESIESLTKLIERCRDVTELEPLNKITSAMVEHSHPEDLFQFPITGENHRYIIYKLVEFTDTVKIIELYDLLFIPKPIKTRQD